jgi:hypothetical protein
METAEDTGSTRNSDVWTATGRERQVFLDVSGRRARRMRAAGALAAVVGGGTGFASLPALRPSLIARAPAPSVVFVRGHHGHARRGHAHPVEVAQVSNRG